MDRCLGKSDTQAPPFATCLVVIVVKDLEIAPPVLAGGPASLQLETLYAVRLPVGAPRTWRSRASDS